MKSIRFFLVVVILAVLTLFNFVAALRGYQSSMAEADRLFDKQLLDTAKLIANIHTAGGVTTTVQNSTFGFQVWRQDKLIASSSNAPRTAIAPLTAGFDYSNFSGYRWRTLAYFDTSNQYWVVAAERSDVRYILAENIVFQSIIPIVLGIPLVGLLIWIIVSQGLWPLKQLAAELGNKRADDLSPLSAGSSNKELKGIVQSCNQLMARLKGSLERESQFASDAAHELRTPISTLKVQLHNIGEAFPNTQKEFRELSRSTEKLGHIVEQILDLYRSSPDRYNAKFSTIDLDTLVEELLAREYPQFDKKNQALEFLRDAPGQACFIAADRFAISTLLQNLLSNANKYTPAGGQIGVSTRRENMRVILDVEDSGIGIPEALFPAVFERFYRVGGDRHQSGEAGCGLGLAIVRRIAESHSAVLRIQHSRYSSGSLFSVSFPAVVDDYAHCHDA